MAKAPKLTPRVPGAPAPVAETPAPAEPIPAANPEAAAPAGPDASAESTSTADMLREKLAQADDSASAAPALAPTHIGDDELHPLVQQSMQHHIDKEASSLAGAADDDVDAASALEPSRDIPITDENVNAARNILLAHARGDEYASASAAVTAEDFKRELFGSEVPTAEPSTTKKVVHRKPAISAPRGRLPEPHEVDPAKLTRSVLTTKGYVVPSTPAKD